jgi:Domain of unknown function (DUF4114)/RTX calcium-binding nonapeptide repeat (4 copies)
MATVNGTANNDILFIESGKSNDTLLGLAGNDYLDALPGAGNNILKGGDGNDELYAFSNDQLFGEAGNDSLSSDGNGQNTLDGGDGDDTLFADRKDFVIGGAGNDIIYGGLGGNTLTGGLGKDIFWIAQVDVPTAPNIITDFNQFNDTIRVNLAGVNKLSDLAISQTGIDATLSFGGNQLAIVKNTLASALNTTTIAIDSTAVNNPGNTPLPLISQSGAGAGIFQLSHGIGTTTGLRFNKVSHKASNRNELGVFVVDDNNGTVNGITPDKSNYLAEVLKRSQVVFSVLSDSAIDTALDVPATRTVNLPINSKLGFYLATNSTAEEAPTASSVLFSFPSATDTFQYSKVSQTGNIIEISFEDSNGGGDKDFDDLVVQIEAATNPAPLGSNLQGTKEILDFTTTSATIKATFEIKRDAGYNNHIGFYKIEDALGTIKVGNNLLKPADAGYRQAAVQGRLAGIDLVGTNGQTVNSTGVFLGGALYAPLLISNAATANADFSNVYTAYILGNADKADHIRLLGDNTFGFEDLFGGGDSFAGTFSDRDFNDVIVKATFQ